MTIHHVGGVSLPNAPIMIGAGVCKTPQSTRKWLTVAPVVSGSYTPEQREGNKGNRLFYPDTLDELLKTGKGFNWFGMPNMGFKAAARELAGYRGEQPFVVSVAGFSVEDYLGGVEKFTVVEGVAAIELNFGCPNTKHGKIMSFDPNSLDTLFRRLGKSVGKPIWVKFSPYDDTGLLKEVASIVNKSRTIRAVVTCNTVPNQFAGEGNLSSPNSCGGLSGPAIKQTALEQVTQFRKHLNTEIDVIGVGGITTGNDVIDRLDAGAKAVQLTSLPFWSGNPGDFWEILLDQDTGGRLEAYLNNEL
ncbi:hypothetical protein HQ403_02390 [Candidatus Kaiserbacteria bacterium]|nr:hypothetical protein [Candidatus Kaiserbacteria bacterium]